MYAKNSEFTDAVAAEYLARVTTSDEIRDAIKNRDLSRFILVS